jgi:hypothetical protein
MQGAWKAWCIMETILNKRLEIMENDTDNNTHLRISVYYMRDAYNSPRGYYISVAPVEVSECGGVMMESCELFSGYKSLLLEVSRKSKKAEAKALEMAEEMQASIVSRICEENGYKLA